MVRGGSLRSGDVPEPRDRGSVRGSPSNPSCGVRTRRVFSGAHFLALRALLASSSGHHYIE